MIRYPHRFHASVTPGGGLDVEPCANESPRRPAAEPHSRHYRTTANGGAGSRTERHFDFRALLAALG